MIRAARSLALLLPAALAALAAAPAAHGAGIPGTDVVYQDGHEDRRILDGAWLFRPDAADSGLRRGWQRRSSTAGWSRVGVPHAWNAGDESPASMAGGVGWYRKDFAVPDRSAGLRWIVRFESVNHRATVWLNGRRIGRHRGAYLPFEMVLDGLRRGGVNRLVVRVDSRRKPTDLPPAGTTSTGVPTGGWWNYGGVLREVYIRPVRGDVDLERVVVRPHLRCSRCAADVRFEAVLRNLGRRAREVRVTGRFGGRSLTVGTATVAPGGQTVVARALRVRRPRLWSPASPYLYDARVQLHAATGARLAGHRLHTGVRSVRVADGRLLFNGEPVTVRGVGFHEDSPERGSALTSADRRWLVDEARALGATMLRTHYPPHPHLHELADRLGLLIWSEIPMYAMKTTYLKRRSVRRFAEAELRRNIEANQNHVSVAVWSIANELSPRPGPTQGYYIERATEVARSTDPTRPVALVFAGYPTAGCQARYAPLDIIGVNEYFGWYPGPWGQLMDRTRLGGYLDQVRACYPDKAVMVTEFGAEANRDGPVEEKGTWAFQRDFVDYHLGVFAQKPWLSGTLYWALNEFRVRPQWDGGNPRPHGAVHQKGLVRYDRTRKPAFADVRRWFTGGGPAAAD